MSDHSVRVIRIEQVLPHPNADRLEIVPVGGFQVVVGKGNYKVGDLAVYVQPDSIVPEYPEYSFIWDKDGGSNPRTFDGPVPEKYRRVTVRRLRKEYSEGLLLPVDHADEPLLHGINGSKIISEGDDVAEFLGIRHYNPPEDVEDIPQNGRSVKQSKIWPRSLKGWMYFLAYWGSFTLYNPWGNLGGMNEKAPLVTPPIYDVEAYKNHVNALELGPDEHVVVTEKIHGSNARFTFEKLTFSSKMYAGSRKLWKREGSSIWRQALKDNPDIQLFCEGFPGYTLYGEVVPSQKGFDYGVDPGKAEVFLFDVRTPEGEWLPYLEARRLTESFDCLKWAPVIYQGQIKDLPELLKLADGQTLTGGKHIREGIVIRVQPEKIVRGLGRAQVKVISNQYYEQTKND